MLLLKVAIRNITHAGLRTWLNVIVLSFAFVAIVVTEGIYDGIAEQMRDAEINSFAGGGQFWQKNYDPLDAFSLELAHSQISPRLKKEIEKGNAVPVFIAPAAIFPGRRIQSVRLNGIDLDQRVINIPAYYLKESSDTNVIPGIIGIRMSKSTGLKEGDYVSARWRNIKGTFDAGDIKIIKVVEVSTPSADKDRIWIQLDKMQKMMYAPGEASIIVLNKNIKVIPANSGDWLFRDKEFLLKDINDNIERKKIYSSFMYVILIGMALLAIFDTQVLSIFKRGKEMGTLMALGMTRMKVIILFTLEGCITGILAFIAGSIYGIPLLYFLAKKGIMLPKMVQQSQYALGLMFYPKYGFRLYLVTALIVFTSVIIISYLPAHRITKLKPGDALKGKI
jgi:putative ABC transport system permease protein